MGKLNIAHHKSYHPYRRDNIERVRRDEEEAQLKEAAQDGKIALAVSVCDLYAHVMYQVVFTCRMQKLELSCFDKGLA
jgi:hypothetical protein